MGIPRPQKGKAKHKWGTPKGTQDPQRKKPPQKKPGKSGLQKELKVTRKRLGRTTQWEKLQAPKLPKGKILARIRPGLTPNRRSLSKNAKVEGSGKR